MKKNYSKQIALLGGLLLLLTSCEKWLDKDLSSDKLNILAPKDSLKTAVLTQNFWWDKLDGATSYNLQIVSPSFENPEEVLYDTNLTLNRVAILLDPDKNYQWRVIAKNGYSNTSAVIRTLFIDNTNDLNIQSITLVAPLSGDSVAMASNGQVSLSWKTLSIADYYLIRVDTLSSTIAKNVAKDSVVNVSSDLTSFSNVTGLKKGGYYKWSVQAFNKQSKTPAQTTLPTFKVKK